MSIFDFYQTFAKDADLADEAEEADLARPARRARELLKLRPEHATAPDINVGVRFLFHLAHALKTLTPPGDERVDADPCVVVDLPLDCSRLLHMFPPCIVGETSDAHKALWAEPDTHTYDEDTFVHHLNRNFILAHSAHAAFPSAITLQVSCPLCTCYSKIVEDMGQAVATIEEYTKQMAMFCCPHCGLQFSCLNPSIEVGFGGIRRKD